MPKGDYNKKTNETFLKEVFDLVGDEYSVLEKYSTTHYKILMKHNLCGNKWKIAPSKFLIGRRCPKCSIIIQGNMKRKGIDVFSKEVFELTDGEYSVIGKYINNRTPIEIIHKKCGTIWKALPSNVLKESLCPNCASSKGEKIIHKFLSNNEIIFEREYTFSGCRNKRLLPFDFYLCEQPVPICIEYDGILHYEDKFNNPKEFKELKKRDRIKTKYCKDNGIKLIRIPYWDFKNIEKILTEVLIK